MKERKGKRDPAQISFAEEIIVDLFAGGGGASTGIEIASGRVVAAAINHDEAAVLLHKTNHPYTEHYRSNVWEVDPLEVCNGRPVGLLWASPDCKHFSKAKGRALRDRHIRALAWVVLRWAAEVRPRVIMLENVEEFTTWGPVRKGKPVKKKAGTTFRKWKWQLQGLGYQVEHRELVAADYGAPTSRKRFVLCARCDGRPIIWPERTHAPAGSPEVLSGKCKPWRSAAEILDFSRPCPSIFDTKAEIKAKYGLKAQRPLADNTMRRIICGTDKFTIKSAQPYIVPVGYGERKGQAPRVHDPEAPLPTTVGAGHHALAMPLLTPHTVTNTTNSIGSPADQPVHTITSAGNQILVEPTLTAFAVECNHSGPGHTADLREPCKTITAKHTGGIAAVNLTAIGHTGGGDRTREITDPVHTIVSKNEVCVTAAYLMQYHDEKGGKARVNGVEDPLATVDTANRHGLCTVHLSEFYGNGRPLEVESPLRTVTAKDREALTVCHLDKYYGGGYTGVGNSPREPLTTVTAEPRHSLAAVHVAVFKGKDKGQDARIPLRTITAANEFAEVRANVIRYEPGEELGHWPEIRALLNRYCGYDLAENELILLNIAGVWYYISDIGLRMLTPRELYNAMGFPVDYAIDRDYLGNEYPKDQQIAKCGNSVPPPLAEAMVRANLPEWCGGKIETMEQLRRVVAV